MPKYGSNNFGLGWMLKFFSMIKNKDLKITTVFTCNHSSSFPYQFVFLNKTQIDIILKDNFSISGTWNLNKIIRQDLTIS